MIDNFSKPLEKLCTTSLESEVIAKVSEIFGVDILEKTNKSRYSNGRFLAMVYLRKHTDKSLHDLADIFGKTHTMPLHAKKIIGNLIETKDKVYFPLINEFQDTFKL